MCCSIMQITDLAQRTYRLKNNALIDRKWTQSCANSCSKLIEIVKNIHYMLPYRNTLATFWRFWVKQHLLCLIQQYKNQLKFIQDMSGRALAGDSQISQMNPQHYTPFIINLSKTPAGYTFHSLEQQHAPHQKAKRVRPPPKPSQNKITNRLIKEIGLISDTPFVFDDHQPVKEPHQDEQKQDFQPPQQEEEIDIEVKRNIALPKSPAEWFDQSSIHPLQVDVFPEFYSGRSYKTAQLYQCYRNFMVDAYHKNPLRYLTFVSLRRVLRGDASCLLKIFNFLQDEGIINYGLFYEGNYTFEPTASDKTSTIGKRPQSCIKKMPQVKSEKAEEMDTDNLTVTVINKNFSRTFRVYCNRCKLICGIVWYANNSIPDENARNLCYQCYNQSDGEAVRGFVKVDILKKMDVAKDGKQVNKTSWGLEDNIKLLQFMGNCWGRSWQDLMNQFQGKKALEDIIIQFMQFPITNFHPQMHASKLKHAEIDYNQQEHVDMLLNLYRTSHHAAENDEETKLKKEEEERKADYRGEEAPTFKQYSSLIIKKYMDKMDNLHKMETALEEANLSIIEQPLCKRMRISQNFIQEQEEDMLAQDDE